ncbi:hypothetical protein CFU_4266 [Collimonas fungivorans Ter331]|uniref:Uncharacterized protein n=1 Tax=Collimonas fungivorans (strain Ter331) TaxID=1005048 RepID=G0AFJ8_COLFT|nr:hypothetical protein CFU_4266 [Collimonas fungivorans Ter331]
MPVYPYEKLIKKQHEQQQDRTVLFLTNQAAKPLAGIATEGDIEVAYKLS